MHGKERCGLDSTGTTGSGIVGTGKAYITPGIIADMLRLLYAAETYLEGSSMLPQCSGLPLYPHSKQPSAVLSEGCVQVCACNQGACLAMLVIPQASAK